MHTLPVYMYCIVTRLNNQAWNTYTYITAQCLFDSQVLHKRKVIDTVTTGFGTTIAINSTTFAL